MSVPAIRALRQIFPAAEITLHIRTWAEGIFRDVDFVDRIITYERTESGLNEVIEQSRALRAENFDLAVILPSSFASALTARFAGIPRRFGFSKEARGLFLTDPIRQPEWKRSRHEVYYYLRLIEEIETRVIGTNIVSRIEPQIDITVSDERRREALEFLQGRGLEHGKPIVAIGAGATNSRAKRWPVENYATLATRLQNEFGAQLILLGDASEAATSQHIAAAAGGRVLDLVGKTSLADAVAILSVSDLLICNDMGLAHIAPAVGTRTLVIFGPTDPTTTRPFSPLAQIVRHEVECSPCMLRDCPIDHRCMTRIAPTEVFEAAAGLIQKNERTIITTAGNFPGP